MKSIPAKCYFISRLMGGSGKIMSTKLRTQGKRRQSKTKAAARRRISRRRRL